MYHAFLIVSATIRSGNVILLFLIASSLLNHVLPSLMSFGQRVGCRMNYGSMGGNYLSLFFANDFLSRATLEGGKPPPPTTFFRGQAKGMGGKDPHKAHSRECLQRIHNQPSYECCWAWPMQIAGPKVSAIFIQLGK